MARSVSRSPISIADRPIYGMLIPIPIVCFIGNLLTDLSYLGSGGNLTWLYFSTWLNAAGLLFGAIAAVVLFIDTIRSTIGWAAFLLFASAWIIEFIGALVHARDGWTGVAGLGLILSIVGVLLILISGWLWQSIRYERLEARP